MRTILKKKKKRRIGFGDGPQSFYGEPDFRRFFDDRYTTVTQILVTYKKSLKTMIVYLK